MDELEYKWDHKLNIDTIGCDDSTQDLNHYPYELTKYVVLEKLAESGYLDKESFLIDYGCGKGRVGLYLDKKIGCNILGIEFNPLFFKWH